MEKLIDLTPSALFKVANYVISKCSLKKERAS